MSEVLSPRHVQVLSGLAAGQTPAEVAKDLGIGQSRVWQLAMEARQVLGASTTAHVVALAMSLGLIEVEHGQGGRLRRAREHLAAAAGLLA